MRRIISILLLGVLFPGIAPAQTSRSAASYFNRAMRLYAQGNFDGAISDFDAAIAFDPAYFVAYSSRGAARYKKRDFGGAIADFNRAIEINLRAAEAITIGVPLAVPVEISMGHWLTTHVQ